MRQLLFFFSILIISLYSSCKKDEFETGQVDLSFSTDTVIFDTVFTSVGSATQVFQVFNNGDNPVKISSIHLASGNSSNFRLNVDGIPGKAFSNVEIGGKDSLFIFVEVTVDPNNGNTPLIVTDSIIFMTNGFLQDIDLVAWGQDAYFHRAPANSQIAPFFILDCNEVWNNDKPHVVYGYAMIDSACTLTINEGTNVFFHPGSGIIALNSSTLKVNGTKQNNVTFQGDRLGADFKDIPGQWDRIWLSTLNIHTDMVSPGPVDSYISYAIIKNGTIGLLVDSVNDGNSTTVTLKIDNTIIKNMASNALATRGANVTAYNSVFANCGAQTTNLLFGGQYNFYHCTFANFWKNGQRQDPAVTLNNWYKAVNNSEIVRSLNAYFGNCIIYGANDNELGYDSASTGNQFGFVFDHTMIKVESTFPTSDQLRYNSIVKAINSSINPYFKDVDNNNYELDSISSAAFNTGDITITQINSLLNFDLLGNPRPVGSAPDLGAYERQ